MFLPFLPYIVALAAVAAFATGAAPAPGTALSGGGAVLAYGGLLLLGLLLGHVPESVLGQRSPMRFSRRRIVLLGLWLAVVGTVPLYAALAKVLDALPGARELALGALLCNYWLADGLSLHPVNPFRRGLRHEARQLGAGLRVPLPVMVLFLLGLAYSVVGARSDGWWEGLAAPWRALATAAESALYLGLVVLAVPPLIRYSWGLHPLEGPAEAIIRAELAANGVTVGQVLNWPERLLGNVTAGVIGLVPGFRYLLFSETLARALAPEEIRAVAAHEAAHLKYRHLWYYLAAILAFVVVVQLALQGVMLGSLLLSMVPPSWALVALEVGALLVFLRYGLGFLSRHFERQADGNAVRRAGLHDFQQAMAKVGQLNHIRPEADNWHHHGIGKRMAFAQEATLHPERLARHDRKVGRIKVACLALLGVGLALHLAATAFPTSELMAEAYWGQRLEGVEAPGPAEVAALEFLASRAYERDDLAAAEKLFRRLVDWRPDEPRFLNNLAWLLLTRPPHDPVRLAEGQRLAEVAAAESEEAFIWDTLAEARLRAGRPQAALFAARRALALARSGRGRGDAPLNYYRNRVKALEKGSNGASSP